MVFAERGAQTEGPALVSAVGLAGFSALLVFAIAPDLSPVLHGETARTAAETATGLACAAAAAVAFARTARLRQRGDLLCALGLSTAALTALLGVTAPDVATSAGADSVLWMTLPGRLAAAVLLAGAALLPARRLERIPGVGRMGLLALAVTLAGAAVGLLADRLGLSSTLPGDGDAVTFGGVYLTLLVASAAFNAAGAVGFARQTRLPGDDWPLLLGAALALAVPGRLAIVVLPGPPEPSLGCPEVFRLVVGMLLVVAAAREFQRIVRWIEDTAASGERRRMAHDLHDGVAQELAYLVSHGRSLARRLPDDAGAGRLAEAAERALTDSRAMIEVCEGREPATLGEAVQNEAVILCERAGLALVLELPEHVDPEADCSQEVRHAVLCILREALSNVARHAEATRVTVTLRSVDHRVELRISDNGKGVAGAGLPRRRGGVGLTSMSERAEQLGGELRFVSRPGQGSVVNVALP